MGFIKFFLVTIISIILIAFCAVNRTSVAISLFPLPFMIDIPVFIFALICMALGIIIGGITTNIKLLQNKILLKQNKKRMEALENENKILRSEQEYSKTLSITKHT